MPARKRKDEGLPVAFATQGGLLATLAVLLLGTMNGTRAWILLIKGAMTFLLVSAILRLMTAAVLQSVRWKADAPRPRTEESEEMATTADVIQSTAHSPEPMEKVAS